MKETIVGAIVTLIATHIANGCISSYKNKRASKDLYESLSKSLSSERVLYFLDHLYEPMDIDGNIALNLNFEWREFVISLFMNSEINYDFYADEFLDGLKIAIEKIDISAKYANKKPKKFFDLYKKLLWRIWRHYYDKQLLICHLRGEECRNTPPPIDVEEDIISIVTGLHNIE